MRNWGFVRSSIAALIVLLPARLDAQDTRPVESDVLRTEVASDASLYVKVQLHAKLSALRPGDAVEGTLARSVYSRDKELFPAGSRVRLSVDKLERRRRMPNDHWPWVIKVFTPRHEKYPTFRFARISLADGEDVPLRVSLVSIGHEVEVRAETRKEKTGGHPVGSGRTSPDLTAFSAAESEKPANHDGGRGSSLTGNFEAVILDGKGLPRSSNEPYFGSSGRGTTVAPGTKAEIVLLQSISASKSRLGDSFRARLVEPVYSGSTVVLPEGSILEGRIVKRTPPRMLSRSGSILLSLTAVAGPGVAGEPISASVAAVELDRGSHTRVDPEGQLVGERPGKAWMAINLAVAGGISKEVDDGAQLLIEAIVSSATDVSTAGTARIAGACVSGIFLLTRHGRDVVLPRFTEMEIVFDRPASLGAIQPVAAEEAGPTQSSNTEK